MAADDKKGVVYECEHKRDEICREKDSMYLMTELKCKKCVYGTTKYDCMICKRTYVMVEGFYTLNVCIFKDKNDSDNVICAGCLRNNHLVNRDTVNCLLLDLDVKTRGDVKENARKQLTNILKKTIEYNKFKKDLLICQKKIKVYTLFSLFFKDVSSSDIFFIIDNLTESQLTTLSEIIHSCDVSRNAPPSMADILFCLMGVDRDEIKKKYSFL